MSAPALYTVGHGTRTVEELAAVVTSAGGTRIVDVRRHPGSRRLPHLGRDNLTVALPQLGVDYEWEGDALGGRRSRRPDSPHTAWRNASFQGYADHMDTPEFRAALLRLLDEVRAGPATAVMCSETLWWRCHRRMIADAALLHGTPVVHLLSERDHPAHPLHPDARPGEDGWPVYDGGQAPLI